MTLAWSRHQYAELITNQKAETWLGCHRRAFEFFNGVPRKIIIDNPKCAITKACFRDPQVQRSYGECAEGYGFIISPCPPGDPQKKGRIERALRDLRDWLRINTFQNLKDLNRKVEPWRIERNQRIHRSTKKAPLEVVKEEKLKALPAIAYHPYRVVLASISKTGFVEFETSA